MSLKSKSRPRLIGEPSPVEVRKLVNDLIEDVQTLAAKLEAAEKRIAALEAAG